MRMEGIQARLRQQEEENKQLAAERKRKLEELQQKVGGWVPMGGWWVGGCFVLVKPCPYRPLHVSFGRRSLAVPSPASFL